MFERFRMFLGWYPKYSPIGEESELQRVLYEYTDLLYTNNLLGTLDYWYPKIFERIPEPQFWALAEREIEDTVGGRWVR